MKDCIDLRSWAKTHSYRFRYEESYLAELPQYRGDGRWYAEIPCRYGLIYPKGGDTLLAYCNSGIKARVAALSPDIGYHQTDGNNEILMFRSELLDKVSKVLKPRRKRSTGASPERLRAMRDRRKSLGQIGQNGSKTKDRATG